MRLSLDGRMRELRMTEEEILELGAHSHELCSLSTYDGGNHDHYCDVIIEGCDDFECIRDHATVIRSQRVAHKVFSRVSDD